VNLLGFATTFLIGLFLKIYPASLRSKLMRSAVAPDLIAAPVTLELLTIFFLGSPQIAPVLGLASMSVMAAIILFAISVFRATGKGKLGL
jgi:hypothetical protein